MSVKSKMTSIADKIRTIRGTSDSMGLDAMADGLDVVQTDMTAAFSAVGDKGGTVPSSKVSGNLATAINSIPAGVGAVLTVTAPSGVTVEVSKDGEVKTQTSNSEGLAVFTGLATGTWTLTITNGEQTTTKPIVITADYSTTIAFFSATINITYPAGSTCTCSDGSTTFTASDTSGTWVCIVPNTGSWTVSCTDGTNSKSETVSITADGQSFNVEVSYTLYVVKSGNLKVGALYSGMTARTTSGILTIKQTVVHRSEPLYASFGPIDSTSFKTLYVEIEGADLNDEYVNNVGIGETANTTQQATVTILSGDKTLKTIDISALSGNSYKTAYVVFRVESDSDYRNVKVSNIWFK